MKLGDTVSGRYDGVPFVGVLVSFDSSGYAYVDLNEPVVVYGRTRDSLAFGPWERDALKLVASGPELAAEDVSALGSAAMGLVCLRSALTSKESKDPRC